MRPMRSSDIVDVVSDDAHLEQGHPARPRWRQYFMIVRERVSRLRDIRIETGIPVQAEAYRPEVELRIVAPRQNKSRWR